MLDGLRGLKHGARALAWRLRAAGLPVDRPTVLRELAHDPQAFTQGLCVHHGVLYESTGLHRRSSVRRIDRATGRVERCVRIDDPEVWAEGIAGCGDHLVQLTWEGDRIYRYRTHGLEPVGALAGSGPGWGLAACEGGFVTSDGSDTLCFRDASFRVERRVRVRWRGLPLSRLNDLEYVAKRVLANVWHDDHIYVVDAVSGRVVRIVDCRDLVPATDPPSAEHALNGIAYASDTRTFFLTGKCWPVLYEVRLPALAAAPEPEPG